MCSALLADAGSVRDARRMCQTGKTSASSAAGELKRWAGEGISQALM